MEDIVIFLNTVEKDILNKFKENNIPLDEVKLLTSSKKELGDYQINDAMNLLKSYINHQERSQKY